MQQKMEAEEGRVTEQKQVEKEEEKEEEEEESEEEGSGCAVFSSSPLSPEDLSPRSSQAAPIDLSVSHCKSYWVSLDTTEDNRIVSNVDQVFLSNCL